MDPNQKGSNYNMNYEPEQIKKINLPTELANYRIIIQF